MKGKKPSSLSGAPPAIGEGAIHRPDITDRDGHLKYKLRDMITNCKLWNFG